jgi:hypothetical protein
MAEEPERSTAADRQYGESTERLTFHGAAAGTRSTSGCAGGRTQYA